VHQTEGLELLRIFTSPLEAKDFLKKNLEEVDLIFLDIEMPLMNGLELLDLFVNPPSVVIITAKERYALKAFDYKIIHYLVKPIEYGKFLKAVERVFEQKQYITKKNTDFLFIRDSRLLYKISFSDILYFEALGDYVKVVTQARSYSNKITMKVLEEKLKMHPSFVRCHRSYIINLHFLENFDAESATVEGKIIPIGMKYRAELSSRLHIL
jgi:DNA-binding LytR/AlgR family response regulator